MQLSNWKTVSQDGEIPEDLLPCGLLQYRWVINHEFTPTPTWLGLGGGRVTMEFELAIDGFESADTVTFFCVTLADPLIGWLVQFYTYWPEELLTTGPDTTPTLGGDELDWQYDGPTVGAGMVQVFIMGWIVSPVYELGLDAEATVDVRKHFPCSGIPDPRWMLQMRTAPGVVGEMPVFKDEATGDRHHFRIHRKVALTKRKLSAFGAFDGPVEGLTVTAAGGLNVKVSEGWGHIGQMPAELTAEATVAVPASTRSYVFAVVEGTAFTGETPVLQVEVTEEPDVPEGAAYLLAIVDAGASEVPSTGIDTAHQGTVVCYDADAIGATREDNGRMKCSIDRGSSHDEEWESQDKGLRWAQQ